MMKRHTLDQQDNILSVTRKRSKAGVIFGLPALCVGSIAIVLGVLTVLAALSTGSLMQALPALLFLCVGVGFFTVGAFGVFGRSGASFDRHDQLVKQWTNLLLLSWDKVTSLDGFDALTIDERLWRGRPCFSLSFTGQSRLIVLDTRRGRDILELASRLSLWFALPVHNRSDRLANEAITAA
ncbi:MAG: hypothetical protein ACR2NU_11305 [Aeoliella sp.]